MAINALQIKGLKPKLKPYKVADEKGLYIEVLPSGAKHWRFKYRFNGKEKRLALGSYPEVGLAEARDLRDGARKLHRDGLDPGHERKMSKIAGRISAGNSFQSVADEYVRVKLEMGGRAEATITKTKWLLDHLTPALGTRPIADIQPAELLEVLKKAEKAGKRETARRLRALASNIFRFGVATTRCSTDPAALLSNALAAPKVQHRAAILDPVKFGELLRVIDAYSGGPIVRLALQIAPHVFLRPGELRWGRWDEIDWEDAVWHVPAARTKMRAPHSAPLSRQVIALLKELQGHSGDGELMFPGERSAQRAISENTLNAAFRRMDYDKDTITAHGLRSTASTLLNESGKWHPDAIERALAHGHSDAVRGAYARGQHWDERVQMAQWWSDKIDNLRFGAEIVPLKTGKKS